MPTDTLPHNLFSNDEAHRRAHSFYEDTLRFTLETEENIGRIVIIYPATNEYAVGDKTGIAAVAQMQSTRGGNAPLFAIRIGYIAADAQGGMIGRIRR